nr:hypothetical protein [Pseudomonas sp. HS-2]
MQNIAVKDILHEELRIKLKGLARSAEKRFSKLSCFKGASWEDSTWLYKGRHKIYLLARGELNAELILLNKVFLVSYLWERRSESKQVTAGRVIELASPLKYMAAQGVVSLQDLSQSFYMKTFGFIRSNYKSPAGACRSLNIFIKFLFESSLIVQGFDLIGGGRKN